MAAAKASTTAAKFSVELNSVNRKQSDVVVTLPRELAELEPRVRDVINAEVSRGRLNVVIACHQQRRRQRRIWRSMPRSRAPTTRRCSTCRRSSAQPARSSIETVLRAPGVLRLPEESLPIDEAWPHVEAALKEALGDLVKMREREGKHLAKDLIKRLKMVRDGGARRSGSSSRTCVKRYRQSLHDRIAARRGSSSRSMMSGSSRR